MSILRLVERALGEGDLVREGAVVLRAGYEMSRYQEFAVQNAEMRAIGEVVEGHLHAPPEALEPLLGTSAPITLHLDDGRRVDLFVVNGDGLITSADERGFY